MEYFNQITDKYLDLLHGDTHHKYTLKLEILGENGYVVGDITKDIDKEVSGQININYQQMVRRSCSLGIANVNNKYLPTPDNPFWIDSKFILWLGLRSTEDTFWFSQGVFITKSATLTNHILSIEGIDKGGILNGDLGTTVLKENCIVQRGSSITTFIKDTLSISENGYMIDTTQPLIDTRFNNIRIQTDMTINRDEHIGKLFVDIADSYNADIYYDVEGRLNLAPAVKDYTSIGSQFDFTDENSHYMDSNLTYNYGVVNAVTVYSNLSTDEEQNVSYTAYNRNPQSPFNVKAIKTRYMSATELKYANVSKSEMMKRCRDYAKHLLLSNSLMKMTESFNTCIVPHLDVNKPITITDKSKGLDHTMFVVQSLSIPLSAGNMSVDATNLSYLPMDIEIEKG